MNSVAKMMKSSVMENAHQEIWELELQSILKLVQMMNTLTWKKVVVFQTHQHSQLYAVLVMLAVKMDKYGLFG